MTVPRTREEFFAMVKNDFDKKVIQTHSGLEKGLTVFKRPKDMDTAVTDADKLGTIRPTPKGAALRRMLKLAKRERKIHEVPFIEFLKEPSARKGFLEPDKFNELIGLLPTHLRPLVTFLYYDGVRIGEALQVEWSQVNLDARTIRLEEEQTKTDEARTLPLPSVLVNMLNEVTPKSGRVFDGTNLRKEWVTACAAAQLGTLTEVEGRRYDPLYSGLTLHDLRRSAVRNLVNAGVPERVAMKITGHKTRSVLDRYHIVSTEDVTDAMQAVETASLTNGKKALSALDRE